MQMSEKDRNFIIERYTKSYNEYGYSPKSLRWDKGKQDVRFNILTSLCDLNNKSILDIGCGFGDLNSTLKLKTDCYRYLGIDIFEGFTEKAKTLYGSENIEFLNCEFLESEINMAFDYVIASGIFNLKMHSIDNYSYIEATIAKALSLCNDNGGIAFDFFSDKANLTHEIAFASSPEKILSIAYQFSRNVVIRNDYMPFEFALFIFKNDSFKAEDTLFEHYKHRVSGLISI
jgi:2-polyprenyl-3-methyl-5-hydroxy-6-metoxy-1,4-benzoquinol methylase